jgi:parallel beta-helix repeat protein
MEQGEHTMSLCRQAAGRGVLAGALALGGALVLGGARPAAAVPITSCNALITTPGIFVLANDLACPGTAITITADNVVLNLNGRTLTGSGSGTGVKAEGTAANPTLEGLRIENGTVAGFDEGVFVTEAPGARVARVTARDNDSDGIVVWYSPGARVEGNTLTGNNFGFYLYTCDGCRLAGNRVTDSEFGGLDLSGSTGARVESNTFTGSGRDGIDLHDAHGALVRGNTATGNGGNGIEVDDGSTGNQLEGNRATGNGTVDLVDHNLPACANTWRSNNFVTDNEGDGPAGGCIR